jgi:hypothetical protein
MQLTTQQKSNDTIIIHKDDDGRIDRPPIVYDLKHNTFTYKTALRFMKANRLANDGIRSGWFITTTIAISRAKWAK